MSESQPREPERSRLPSVLLRGPGLHMLMVLADAAIAAGAVAIAYFARFDGAVTQPYLSHVPAVVLAACVLVPLTYLAFGLYGYVWKYVGVDMLVRLAAAVAVDVVLAFAVVSAASKTLGYRFLPIGVVLIAAAFLFIGSATVRALERVSVYIRARGSSITGRRVLIAGAGDAGSLLLRDIETQPGLGIGVVGFVDDDSAKVGRSIRGIRVLGSIADIPQIVAAHRVQEILVAMPGADLTQRSRTLEFCAEGGVPARIITGMARTTGVGVTDLREVSVTDLLGREPAPVDVDQIRQTIEGKVVAVTGAAGSIGSELCRQLLIADPSRIVLIEIDESRLYELYLELESVAPGIADMRICDIRDDRKLREILLECRPHMVLHAAAYKHVPLMELEPDEAVKTNVFGTQKLLEASQMSGVERFVLISTDKAVKPKSVMGATKSIAEQLVLRAARDGMHASAVRFGNVLGSRGSVVPLFEEQLRRGGPLQVTHPDVTRYFMTISEAARLVLQAQALSEGGDIFVLEMGEPVKIVDLARSMITLSGSSAGITYTGLRAAEKLHEVLTTEREELVPTTAEKVLRLTSIPIPSRDLAGSLQPLSVAARLGDHTAIRMNIAQIVTGFVGFVGAAYEDAGASIELIDPEMETLL